MSTSFRLEWPSAATWSAREPRFRLLDCSHQWFTPSLEEIVGSRRIPPDFRLLNDFNEAAGGEAPRVQRIRRRVGDFLRQVPGPDQRHTDWRGLPAIPRRRAARSAFLLATPSRLPRSVGDRIRSTCRRCVEPLAMRLPEYVENRLSSATARCLRSIHRLRKI